jgi:hemerythrin-like domain-containing protein
LVVAVAPHIVDQLYEDHDHILEALKMLEQAVKGLREGRIEPSIVLDLLNFLSRFADHYHHGVEELVLFPALERRGVPLHGGPIGVMVCEHGMGRYMLRNARKALEKVESGDKSAVDQVEHYTMAYRDLLVQHIDKENNILFAMAKEVIGEGELVDEAKRLAKELEREPLLQKLSEIRSRLEQ